MHNVALKAVPWPVDSWQSDTRVTFAGAFGFYLGLTTAPTSHPLAWSVFMLIGCSLGMWLRRAFGRWRAQ